jgi:hypothetical protein
MGLRSPWPEWDNALAEALEPLEAKIDVSDAEPSLLKKDGALRYMFPSVGSSLRTLMDEVAADPSLWGEQEQEQEQDEEAGGDPEARVAEVEAAFAEYDRVLEEYEDAAQLYWDLQGERAYADPDQQVS